MADNKELEAILVDLDGVLANFLLGALRVFDREDLYHNWPVGQWGIAEVLGVNTTQFWCAISERGYRFWEDLPEYPWTRELWAVLQEIANDQHAKLIVCTAPSRDPECAKGKVMWMHRVFGPKFMDFVITNKKFLMAKEKAILIDDREDTVIRFCAEGGFGMLFPGRTNSYGLEPTTDIVMEAIVEPILRGLAGEPLDTMFPYRNPECSERFDKFFGKMCNAIYRGVY